MKKHRILSSLLLAFLLASPSAHAADPPQDLDTPRDPDRIEDAADTPRLVYEVPAALRAKAEQGDAASQNSLGFIYDGGLLGVTKDKAEAIKWYTKAGDQGFAAAQSNLCSLHASSLRVLKGVNPPKGQALGPIEPVEGSKEDVYGVINWCRKGADQGYAQSQRHLGILYAKGAKGPGGAELVKPDYEEAYFWLSMGRKDTFRDAVGKNLTPERRTEIEKKAKDWNTARPPGPPMPW